MPEKRNKEARLNNDQLRKAAISKLTDNHCMFVVLNVFNKFIIRGLDMWINVNDKQPNKSVLVYGKYGYFIAWYDKGWKTDINTDGYGMGETHWMPLPEPPNSENVEPKTTTTNKQSLKSKESGYISRNGNYYKSLDEYYKSADHSLSINDSSGS